MRSFLALLLLAACDASGETGSGSTTSATSAQAGGGEGDEAGDGGAAAVTVSGATSTSETSTASTGGEGGATMATASSSAASTGAGGEGSGGEGAGCPAARCPQFGVICDPDACGSSSCEDFVCTNDPNLPAHGLSNGTTIIRTPPISEQHPRCNENCDDQDLKWSLRLRVLSDFTCFRFRGPEGFSWSFANAVDDVPPDACAGTAFADCDRGETNARYILVGFRGESTPGAQLEVDISDGDPCFLDEPDPICEGVGCNGAGG